MSLKDPGSLNQGLRELEDDVLSFHHAVLRSYGCAFYDAMSAGDAIIAIKARGLIRHGQWGEFYQRTCGSKRTAQVYVKLAKNRSVLEAKAQSSAHLIIDGGINGALRFLRGQSGTSRANKTTKPPKPSVVSVVSKATDAELTEALAALDFDRFMQIMPAEWRSKLEARFLGPIKTKYPNKKVKHLTVAYSAEISAPTSH